MSNIKKHLPLIFLFTTAFLIRLIGLNQSLWLDEATTAQTVKHFSFFDIVTVFTPTDFHPPVYYLFMKVWISLFGFSEIAIRFPSVIFSLVAGWIIYLIGRKNRSEKVGVVAACLFLFNPLIVYYSQEARMYMMAVCLIALNFYLFQEIVSGSKKGRQYVLFSTTLFLSFATFYGSIFYIGAVLLYLLWKKIYRLFFFAGGITLVTLVILAPFLITQYLHSKILLSQVVNWSQVLGKATLKNLFLIPLKFATGRISLNAKELYYALGGIWTMILFLIVFLGARKRFDFLFFLVVPLVAGVIFSFLSPLLQYFRFLYLIIFLSLLAAVAVEKKQILQILLIEVSLAWTLLYLLFPQYHREDWQRLHTQLSSSYTVYIIGSSSDPLRYYDSYRPMKPLESVQSVKPKSRTIFVVPYTADIHGVDYKKSLVSYGYILQKKLTVRGLEYEIWRSSL